MEQLSLARLAQAQRKAHVLEVDFPEDKYRRRSMEQPICESYPAMNRFSRSNIFHENPRNKSKDRDQFISILNNNKYYFPSNPDDEMMETDQFSQLKSTNNFGENPRDIPKDRGQNVPKKKRFSWSKSFFQNDKNMTTAPTSRCSRSKSLTSNTGKHNLLRSGNRSDSLPSAPSYASRTTNGPDVSTEQKLRKMAFARAEQGEWAESANLFVNVLKLQRERLGLRHPELASTKYHLANALHKVGRIDQAVHLLQEALDVFLMLQKNHKFILDVASIFFLLAVIEEETGNINKAIYYVRETQKVELQALGYTSKKTNVKMLQLQKADSFPKRLARKVTSNIAMSLAA